MKCWRRNCFASGKSFVENFNFNKEAILGSILFKLYSVNTGTGVITINGLEPINHINFPAGATHVTLKGAWLKLNFVTGIYDLQASNVVNLPINATPTNITLRTILKLSIALETKPGALIKTKTKLKKEDLEKLVNNNKASKQKRKS